MDNILIAIGALSLILCVTVVLIMPLVLAIVSDAAWCWAYAFYGLIVLYNSIMIILRGKKHGNDGE